MSKLVDFLNTNKQGQFATIKNGKPVMRPFQFVLERDYKFYFMTSNTKNVYRELITAGVADFAVLGKDMSWLRLNGDVQFIDDLELKDEILDMIDVWAALESMAARLATTRSTDAEIASLRKKFATFDDSEEARAHIDEYSETNIEFHQTIIRLGKSPLITQMSDQLFFHMRAIRTTTIKERDRVSRSVLDHIRIIEAIEERDPYHAEQLVRDHALELAKHVDKFVDYLD